MSTLLEGNKTQTGNRSTLSQIRNSGHYQQTVRI